MNLPSKILEILDRGGYLVKLDDEEKEEWADKHVAGINMEILEEVKI